MQGSEVMAAYIKVQVFQACHTKDVITPPLSAASMQQQGVEHGARKASVCRNFKARDRYHLSVRAPGCSIFV